MTEAEWLASTNPTPMLDFLRGKTSDRKLRLYACACCRRFSHRLTDDRSWRAVVMAEQFEDGLVNAAELDAAAADARAVDETRYGLAYDAYDAAAADAASLAAFDPLSAALTCISVAENKAEQLSLANLLHDLFGHLVFQGLTPIARSLLGWNNGTVPKLAQSIYDDRRFADLPILADALEEAGCTESAILEHCRSGGEHVRGCWVVDLLLGKG